MTCKTGALVALLAGALAPAFAHAQTPASTTAAAAPDVGPELSAGATYLSGKYGQARSTSIIYAPATAAARGTNWRVEATVPYLRVRGPGAVAGSGGTPVVVGSGSSAVTTRSGLGDVALGASYMLPASGSLPLLEVAGRVKLPTAKDSLGTGKTDTSVQLNAYQVVSSNVTLLGSVGYQWLGKSATYPLKSGLTGMLGADVKTSPDVDVGVSASYSAKVIAGQSDQVTLTPYMAWRANRNWGVTAYALAGLTRSSPDYGAGFQLTYYVR